MSLSELCDGLAHPGRLGPIGMAVEKILHGLGRRGRFLSAQVQFGQQQLRVREVRGIEAASDFQIFLRQPEITGGKVTHAELRIGQGILGAQQNGSDVVVDGLVELSPGQQDASEIDQRLERVRVVLEGGAEALLGEVEFFV